MKRDNQNDVCEFVREIVAARIQEPIALVERPDQKRRDIKAVDELWESVTRRFAIEHTLIESFPGQPHRSAALVMGTEVLRWRMLQSGSGAAPTIDFATLDLLPYGIIVVDHLGVIVYYNEREQEISGLSRQSVIGRNFFLDVAPCTDVQGFHGRCREVIERREGTARFQCRFPFAPRPREVEITLTAFEHATLTFGLIAVSDVSRCEEVRTHLMAGERFRALGEVAAGVSHNFNNALAVILGYASLMDGGRVAGDRA